jgi:hypothetical protein
MENSMIANRLNNATLLAELKRIQGENAILNPCDVVNNAKCENNPLHPCFCWDDSQAGEQYRLWQARQLIVRVQIEIKENGTPVLTQAYVSLRDDRVSDGGYRSIVQVMTSADLRGILLKEARQDYKRWEARYKQIMELSPIFEAAKRIWEE